MGVLKLTYYYITPGFGWETAFLPATSGFKIRFYS